MFKINVSAIASMDFNERRDAELTYLELAYAYENEEMACGSRAMRTSPESVCLSGPYTRAERKLINSFHNLFEISKSLKERTGEHLFDFVPKEERTAENALEAWYIIYSEINRLKRVKLAISKNQEILETIRKGYIVVTEA